MDYPTVFTVDFDTSYQFAIELEWCIAEVTCVMLVFCVPALPKMISEHSVLLTSRFHEVWRSWTRFGRERRAPECTSSNKTWTLNQTWVRAIGGHHGSRERITDEESIHTKHTQTGTVELPRMSDQYLQFSKGPAPQAIPQCAGSVIVKAGHFDYQDASALNPPANQFFQLQHLWIKH